MNPTRHTKWNCRDGTVTSLAKMDNQHLKRAYKWLASKPDEVQVVVSDAFGDAMDVRWESWSKDGFGKQEWRAAFERELERRGLDSAKLYALFD